MTEQLAKDEIEFTQSILPKGITLPKDYKSPLAMELSISFDSIQAALEHTPAKCILWPTLREYGCMVTATTAYYPVSWYSLREMGIPSEVRTNFFYWVPICKVCALIPRPRRKSAWSKAAGKHMHKSQWALAIKHESVLSDFNNRMRRYMKEINHQLTREIKKVTRFTISPGSFIPNMTNARVVHIDATGLRNDGSVVIVCST